MESETKIRPRNGSRTNQGSYLVVISNLPLKLDIQSHTKYSTISWRPIKDLLRSVINKREDGTDIRPQEGNPGTVHVWPESDGQCGYAMGTLQKRKHAMRALHWLGGNLWYGRTLSVILYYDGSEGLQYVDSRWMRNAIRLVNLEGIVSVSQKELLQRHPPCATPNVLLCLVPKGSVFSHQRPTIPANTYNEDDNWTFEPSYCANRAYLEANNSFWWSNEAFSRERAYEYCSSRFYSPWQNESHHVPNWYPDSRPYDETFVPPKVIEEKRHRADLASFQITGTISDSSYTINKSLTDNCSLPTTSDTLSMTPVQENNSSSTRALPVAKARILIQAEGTAGPTIADGSRVDPALDNKPLPLREDQSS